MIDIWFNKLYNSINIVLENQKVIFSMNLLNPKPPCSQDGSDGRLSIGPWNVIFYMRVTKFNEYSMS